MAQPAGAHLPLGLLRPDDSVLVVVDLQPGFFAGRAAAQLAGLDAALARAAWLVGVAAALGIPIVVTEEDPVRNGPTLDLARNRLPAGTPVLEKAVFGLAGEPAILDAVTATGRHTAVLVGTETDVCVAQSALGLAAAGFGVTVVGDATFSPGEMHGRGLRRLRQAGVPEVHAKGVYYEWVRTLEAARRFEREQPELASPPGFSL